MSYNDLIISQCPTRQSYACVLTLHVTIVYSYVKEGLSCPTT